MRAPLAATTPASIQANGVSYDFHLLPSGLVAPGCINLFGSGVVFRVPSFFKELADVEAKGGHQGRPLPDPGQ